MSADTPVFLQYRELKAQQPDALLFFRMGDFYELFFEDAIWTAGALELVLTARNRDDPNPIPMCGVPHHAAEGYIARLVELGRKVAIAEQVGVIEGKKALMRREVVRVVTPGLSGDTTAPAHEAAWLVAITGDERGYSVGLLDASTGDMRVTELQDLPLAVAEALRHGPKEALLTERTDLPELRKALGDLCTTVVADRSVDLDELRSHFGRTALDGLEAGLESVAVLLRYARNNLRSTLSNIVSLQRYSLSAALIMDEATRRNLEIFKSLRGGVRKGTLIDLVDRARSPMGGRLLREWLGSPLLDLDAIHRRHDAVSVFVSDGELRQRLGDHLARVSDIERIAARVSQGTATPRNLSALQRSLEQLPLVAAELKKPALIGRLPADLAPDVATDIARCLVPEPPISPSEGGLVPDGVDPTLDRLRELARDGKGAIARMEAAMRDATGINSLKIRHVSNMGYVIDITRANLDRVPKEWIRKQTISTGERYFTLELKEYEEQVTGADAKAVQAEYQHFCALRDRVAEAVPRLIAVARGVAELDALLSLADVAVKQRWVRPDLVEGAELDIKGGRHPVVEAMLKDERFVPNDIRLDARAPMVILTGPNMAGKSTLMRQVALTVVLAQAGSFVPATAATLGLCDRVAVRVGASDDLARGQSTFMVEMSETAAILASATRHSLVLLDEIGRGTSTYDGLSIAWAVAEDLHDRVRCRVIFATHYHELAALSETCGRVRNLHVAVSEQGEKITFLRRLREGAASSSYGIQCARLAGLPLNVVRRAKGVLRTLEARRPRPEPTQLSLFGAPQEVAPPPAEVPPPQLDDPLRTALEAIDPDQLSPREALEAIYRLHRMIRPEA